MVAAWGSEARQVFSKLAGQQPIHPDLQWLHGESKSTGYIISISARACFASFRIEPQFRSPFLKAAYAHCIYLVQETDMSSYRMEG